MTYTLADAIAAQFERDHPGGKNTLLCVGLCRRRKDRKEFRGLPTHGRAAACLNCEGYGIGGGRLWDRTYNDRVAWNLEQAREKLRMYQRYAAKLRAERYDGPPLRIMLGMGQGGSALNLDPPVRASRMVVLGPPMTMARRLPQALSKAHTDAEEEA
ncbi:hypothetical protein [Streptomyces sp. or20]|uniref:hypothetical protein n=1 Tax=Streptomyces sp. or20 TaxID=1828016 RepID=UPI00117F8E4C|nr:hypothetical protein [Streptomyces sp. or20]